ncbi:unnamed protein product [Brassicogethes aeneus]|uniref:USP domain-containing protein n=1 Tax=Brassicogethes aeneus TaxID=1431903 RepID=A0A9P0BCZ6_BRAAE|nr:unnamed protein product [Brassicogethes aeneus]
MENRDKDCNIDGAARDALIIRFASRQDFLELCTSGTAWTIATSYVAEVKPLANTPNRTILCRLRTLCKDREGLKKFIDDKTAKCLVHPISNPSRKTKKRRTKTFDRRTKLDEFCYAVSGLRLDEYEAIIDSTVATLASPAPPAPVISLTTGQLRHDNFETTTSHRQLRHDTTSSDNFDTTTSTRHDKFDTTTTTRLDNFDRTKTAKSTTTSKTVNFELRESQQRHATGDNDAARSVQFLGENGYCWSKCSRRWQLPIDDLGSAGFSDLDGHQDPIGFLQNLSTRNASMRKPFRFQVNVNVTFRQPDCNVSPRQQQQRLYESGVVLVEIDDSRIDLVATVTRNSLLNQAKDFSRGYCNCEPLEATFSADAHTGAPLPLNSFIFDDPSDLATLYDLTTCIVHRGIEVKTGHYVVYFLEGHEIWCCNDESIKATKMGEFEEDCKANSVKALLYQQRQVTGSPAGSSTGSPTPPPSGPETPMLKRVINKSNVDIKIDIDSKLMASRSISTFRTGPTFQIPLGVGHCWPTENVKLMAFLEASRIPQNEHSEELLQQSTVASGKKRLHSDDIADQILFDLQMNALLGLQSPDDDEDNEDNEDAPTPPHEDSDYLESLSYKDEDKDEDECIKSLVEGTIRRESNNPKRFRSRFRYKQNEIRSWKCLIGSSNLCKIYLAFKRQNEKRSTAASLSEATTSLDHGSSAIDLPYRHKELKLFGKDIKAFFEKVDCILQELFGPATTNERLLPVDRREDIFFYMAIVDKEYVRSIDSCRF